MSSNTWLSILQGTQVDEKKSAITKPSFVSSSKVSGVADWVCARCPPDFEGMLHIPGRLTFLPHAVGSAVVLTGRNSRYPRILPEA